MNFFNIFNCDITDVSACLNPHIEGQEGMWSYKTAWSYPIFITGIKCIQCILVYSIIHFKQDSPNPMYYQLLEKIYIQ